MSMEADIKVSQPPQDKSLNFTFWAWLLNFVQVYNAQMVPAPAATGDLGVQGQTAFDDDYFYICTDTNVWKRVAIATW